MIISVVPWVVLGIADFVCCHLIVLLADVALLEQMHLRVNTRFPKS